MKERRMIVDTTLRDGEQSPFVHLSESDKIAVALMLDEIGVYQIEAGVAAISTSEQRTLSKIMEQKKNSRVSVWCRLNADDVKLAAECRPDVIHISIPVSYLHIYKKLGKNKSWILKKLNSVIDVIMSTNCSLSVGFEDATRADLAFMQSLMNVLEPAGAEMVRIADTVGTSSTFFIRDSISSLMQHTSIPIEIHAHNDLGMATANTAEALKAGALFADTTLCGVGERTGNCDMLELVKLLSPIYDMIVSVSEAERLTSEFKRLIRCA